MKRGILILSALLLLTLTSDAHATSRVTSGRRIISVGNSAASLETFSTPVTTAIICTSTANGGANYIGASPVAGSKIEIGAYVPKGTCITLNNVDLGAVQVNSTNANDAFSYLAVTEK